MSSALKRSRSLRRDATEAEKTFWRNARNRQLGYKFYRQFPVGNYIADFLCPELKLIVEIDGGQHNESVADEERTQDLNQSGYHVIRFWNNDVLKNIDGVTEHLRGELEKRKNELLQPWMQPPHPDPLPVSTGRGGISKARTP